MTEMIAGHIETFAQYAHLWGFLLILFFMFLESCCLVPLPSEVVMIPAGFLAFRGVLLTGNPWLDGFLAILAGTAGSLAGAYFNYFLALYVGRAPLYKYGKYFFLKEATLQRAEELFRKYGSITTFVCRLLPGIRQVISVPAGLARMEHKPFAFYTTLGAGIWVTILTAIGAWFGHMSNDMTYVELVGSGEKLLKENYIWLLLGLIVVVVGYLFVHKKIMHTEKKTASEA